MPPKLLRVFTLCVVAASTLPAQDFQDADKFVLSLDTGPGYRQAEAVRAKVARDTLDTDLFRFDIACGDDVYLSIGLPAGSLSTNTGSKQCRLFTESGHHDIRQSAGMSIEWDIVLPSRPDNNILSFPISHAGLRFVRQPELSEAENRDGAMRADSIVGSYAVFRSGPLSTGSPKSIHIFRPRIFDRRGASVLGNLDIDTLAGFFRLIVPPGFRDSAAYPLTIDPVFGFSGVGASQQPLKRWWRSFYTGRTGHDAEGARLDSLTWYVESVDIPVSIIWGLYTDDTDRPDTQVCVQTAGEALSLADGYWRSTVNAFTPHTLTANTVYHFCCLTNSATALLYTAYDSDPEFSENSSSAASNTNYPIMPDVASGFTFHNDRLASVYAWYTAADTSGAERPGAPRRRRLQLHWLQ